MSDRTRVTRQLESLSESLPAMSNAEFEAKRAVGTRYVRAVSVNLNVNSNSTIVLDAAITGECSDNLVVEGFSITSPAAMTNVAATATVVQLWKRAADGTTPVQVAELNTALLSNTNAYVPISANFANSTQVNLSNAEVAQGGTIGLNVTLATTGSFLSPCLVQVTLRQK